MARGRPSKKGVIIEAASSLFTLKGYQGTSIDQVVIAAGVSKPTVYSNFPTKLVLWESVLESLIIQAKIEMSDVLSFQKKRASDQFGILDGWVALWEAWSNSPERLAVYRILLGEQYKMAATTMLLFSEFENVLEQVLFAWFASYEVLSVHFFALKAMTKEAVLMPKLLNLPTMCKEEITAHLGGVVNK
ncbi:MAG: TetR/AcrR family transcriptional regulator [Marinomonas sp.]